MEMTVKILTTMMHISTTDVFILSAPDANCTEKFLSVLSLLPTSSIFVDERYELDIRARFRHVVVEQDYMEGFVRPLYDAAEKGGLHCAFSRISQHWKCRMFA